MDVIEAIAEIVGPIGGIVVGPVAALLHLIAAIRLRTAWPLWTGGVLLLALSGSLWLYWSAFWHNFGMVAAQKPVLPSGGWTLLERTGFTLSVALCLAISTTAVVALVASDRVRSSQFVKAKSDN